MSTNQEYDSEQEIEQSAEGYAFLEEKIKDKAFRKKRAKNTTLKIVAFGLLFGIAASIGFYAVKPLAESLFDGEAQKESVLPEENEDASQAGDSEGEVKSDSGIPYIGLEGEMVTEEIAAEHNIPMGLYVTVVRTDSPAMRAGIQRGDVITEINGNEIKDLITFHSQILEAEIGSVIRLTGQRLGAEAYVELRFRVTVEQE